VMAYARRREAERLQHLRALQAERDKLERAVQQRTETLTELARHLQTVREDERSHLARELHDEMGGLLTAAKLDLARLRARLPGMAPEVAERLEHLRATLDQGIVLKRRIIEDLRPSSLDNLGLQAALDILCREWSERSGVPIHSAVADLPLDPERSLVVYRLVQEALTNIAKYAQARNVMVRLAEVQGAAEVEVSDDGVGFNPQQRVRPQADGQARGHGHGHGHGLVGMQFRVQSCGGTLRLQTAPGQGTRITARLPLPTSIS
jgi:signal transduction histidine kinase